jgi:peptidyl-tRNA hydrolase
MAENLKKIVLMVNQKLILTEKFENVGLATELDKDYGVGIE